MFNLTGSNGKIQTLDVTSCTLFAMEVKRVKITKQQKNNETLKNNAIYNSHTIYLRLENYKPISND